MASLIDFLFIPVSSLHGVGEYTRSLIIAQELRLKMPSARIAFILNENSPVVNNCPFLVFTVEDTPTKCSGSVNKILMAQLPRVVIFDASGRVSQFKTAKKINAKTVFISQHAKKRKKGMQLRRARFTDVHYVVQPEFALPPLSLYQVLKLRLIGSALPVCVGPIFKQPDQLLVEQTLQEYKLLSNEFLLVNAGSGGHRLGSDLASDIFLEAANLIAQQTGLECVVVMGANYPNPLPSSNSCKIIGHLSTGHFAALLTASKFAVLSGGSGFLQAYLLNKPAVVAAVSSDQPQRINACKTMGFGYPSEAKPNALFQAALELIAGLSNFNLHPKNFSGSNGLELVVNGLATLLHANSFE